MDSTAEVSSNAAVVCSTSVMGGDTEGIDVTGEVFAIVVVGVVEADGVCGGVCGGVVGIVAPIAVVVGKGKAAVDAFDPLPVVFNPRDGICNSIVMIASRFPASNARRFGAVNSLHILPK